MVLLLPTLRRFGGLLLATGFLALLGVGGDPPVNVVPQTVVLPQGDGSAIALLAPEPDELSCVPSPKFAPALDCGEVKFHVYLVPAPDGDGEKVSSEHQSRL